MRYVEIDMDDFGRRVIRTGDEALARDSAVRFRQRKREINDALRQMIADAVDDGSIAPVDIRIAAFTSAGALDWPGRWFAPDRGLSREAVAAMIVELLMQGILRRAPVSPDQMFGIGIADPHGPVRRSFPIADRGGPAICFPRHGPQRAISDRPGGLTLYRP